MRTISTWTRAGSTMLVAALVLTATAATPVAARSPEDAASYSVAGVLNAGTVDGLSARKYTSKAPKRRNKLVATNAYGYLPNNIIKKARNADKLDGMDSAAFVPKAGIQVTTRTAEGDLPAATAWGTSATCPSGWQRVGGGYDAQYEGVDVYASHPDGSRGWAVEARNEGSKTVVLKVYVICMKW